MTSKYKNIEQHTKRERRKVTNKWKIFTSQYLY